MDRRRYLSGVKSEGGDDDTKFEFPLYLYTELIEESEDYAYREGTRLDLAIQLMELIQQNFDAKVGGTIIPESFLNQYPIYIDDFKVLYAILNLGSVEEIVTDKDYGYNETYIGIDATGLYVELYN